MGVAVRTIEVAGTRRWRDFDWQLVLYLVLLIGFGIVLGTSAAWNDPLPAGVVPQPVKTVVWTGIGLALDRHQIPVLRLPFGVLDRERDRAPERSPVSHARKDLEPVRLELLAAATAVAVATPRELLGDLLERDRHAGRQTLQDPGERLPMRFTGREQAQQLNPDLLDHLVGAGEQRVGHGEAERLGGLEVDHQLEFCRLLDRQIGRFGAVQDLVYVTRGAPVEAAIVRPIRHETTGFRHVAEAECGR